MLIGIEPNVPRRAWSQIASNAGARIDGRVVDSTHSLRLSLEPGASLEKAIAALRSDPRVRYAEPDYIITTDAVSNDPFFTDGSLWGMYGPSTSPSNAFGSKAATAWASGQVGSHSVAVGIVDEGIQVNHPDLAANIWVNPFEIAGNGVDDDGNGYVDDVNGWDFYHNDATVYDGPSSDMHGTHVAGTIGAVGGNGTGVAGVNWAVTMISAKMMHGGSGPTSAAVKALDYLTDLKIRHGINIVATNNSWGSSGQSQALLEAIERAGDAGIVFVAAAGNSSSDNDATESYPSNYACDGGGTRNWDCLVSVAAIASDGSEAHFTNYGATTVDLGAPGVDIQSTLPANAYGPLSGTSMAAPHVTGALALLAACNSSLTPSQLRTVLLGGAAATTSLAGRTVTGGRLDVAAMSASCAASAKPAAFLVTPPGYITTTTASYTAWFSKSVTGFTTADLTIGGTSTGWSASTVTGSGDGPYTITISAASPSDGTVIVSIKANSVATAGGVTGPPSAVASQARHVDRTPPSVSSPTLSPSSTANDAGAVIGATATDATRVAGAEVRVGSGPWQRVAATDGAFDSPSEAASALLGGRPVQVSAGTDHTCVRFSNGTVRCTGMNYNGQLGDGTSQARNVLVPVQGITNAAAISAGYQHTCAVLMTGQVRCWGWNLMGQLGNGQTGGLPVTSPVAVSGITTAVAVTTGYGHSCALLADTTVRCWGSNWHGRLGSGTTSDSTLPLAVAGLSDVVAVGAGSNHTCALLADGTIECWGSSSFAALGAGPATPTIERQRVVGVSNAVGLAVSGGGFHGCALLAGGGVRCWGENLYGEVGDGGSGMRWESVAVTGISTATAIDVGYAHSCALLVNGTMRCWGDNWIGQLGNGESFTQSATPVVVEGVTDALAISASGAHTCALRADQGVACWGNNYSGQIGDGTNVDRWLAQGVTGANGPLAIGNRTICVRATDGAGNTSTGTSCATLAVTADTARPTANLVRPESPTRDQIAWFVVGFSEPVSGLSASDLTRSGSAGGCSIGTPVGGPSLFRVPVSGCSGGTLTVTLSGSSVVDSSGNTGPPSGTSSAQLTIDRTAPAVSGLSLSPSTAGVGAPVTISATGSDGIAVAGAEVQVDSLGWLPMTAGDGSFGAASESVAAVIGRAAPAVAIAAGQAHTCVVVSDGTVRCWGDNTFGQLGDGTTVSRRTPVAVAGVTSAVQIAAGDRHTCVVLANGGVRCWGANENHQLGEGTTISSPQPVVVTGISTAVDVAAGDIFSCAVLANGGVRCWGHGDWGRLGNGSTHPSGSPVAVTGISSAVEVAAAFGTACARLGGGGVRCWGEEPLGQGNMGRSFSATPVPVSGIDDALSVAAGIHSCVARPDAVSCWGVNGWGELGDGTTEFRFVPVDTVEMDGASAVAVGYSHSCALHAGAVWCWGFNGYGEVGDGTTTRRLVPVSVAGVAGTTSTAAGHRHSCAIVSGGQVWCWGDNGGGQLGDGTVDDSPLAKRVVGLGGPLDAGTHQVCVRAADSAGNLSGSTCASLTVVEGGVPPTAAVTAPASPTKVTTLTYGVAFSEAVSGLAAGDFTRTGTATGCSVGVTGSGASYAVSVSGCSAGTVNLTLKADSVNGSGGGTGPASAVSATTVLIDRSVPSASWASPPYGLRAGVTLSGKALPVRLAWSAVDAGGAGVANHGLSQSKNGGSWKTLTSNQVSPVSDRTLAAGNSFRFRVRTTDAANNTGAWANGPTTKAVLTQQTAGAVSFSGAWSSQSLANASGGSVRHSSAAGARATLSFTGRSVAWVTTVGPNRGAARVYIDGVLAETVDLYAPATAYRQVVFARSWASAGSHTIRVEVVGTPGRPRVDIDAFLRLT